jgi:hypothetical protein
MKKSLSGMLSASLLMLVATSARADVSFDPETGKGFVGKGDIQLLFAWNNTDLQNQANALTFSVYEMSSYDVPCMKILDNTKEVTVLRHTFHRERTTSRSIAYSPRVRNQVTGFLLTGYELDSTDFGKACPGGWQLDSDGVVLSVEGSGYGELRVNGAMLRAF